MVATVGRIQKKARVAREVELPPGFYPIKPGTPHVQGRMALEYLVNVRGVSHEAIEKYRLGVCPIYPWVGRVVMPVFNLEDSLSLVTSRNYTEVYNYPSKSYILGDKVTLYGMHLAKDYRIGVLVEGMLDVLLNAENFVGCMGTTLTPEQIQQIKDWNPSTFIIMLDADATHKACNVARALISSGWKTDLRIAILDEGDPGDAGWDKVTRAVDNSIPVRSELDLTSIEVASL
jgi:hypothetical protein